MSAEILVLLHRDQLDTARLAGRVVVVLDIIFATTTLITALQAGARSVAPAADADSALALRAPPGEEPPLLAGEKDAALLEGFAHYAPQRLAATGVRGRRLVFATTNGTPALLRAAGAERVYAGALLNRAALARHLAAEHAGQSVILLCAGSAGGFNMEDFYGAGAFVAGLLEAAPQGWRPSDSAQAAVAAFRQYRAPQALHASRVGRLMDELRLGDEVDFAARLDVFPTLPRLRDGRLEDIA